MVLFLRYDEKGRDNSNIRKEEKKNRDEGCFKWRNGNA